MREIEVELRIGDSLLIGDDWLTVVDVEGDEVCFRVDSAAYATTAAVAPPGK